MWIQISCPNGKGYLGKITKTSFNSGKYWKNSLKLIPWSATFLGSANSAVWPAKATTCPISTDCLVSYCPPHPLLCQNLAQDSKLFDEFWKNPWLERLNLHAIWIKYFLRQHSYLVLTALFTIYTLFTSSHPTHLPREGYEIGFAYACLWASITTLHNSSSTKP